MASPQTVSFTSPGYDYSADIASIERQRKLAQALQDQSMQQDGQQTAGGWVIPYSPFQGAGKIAQALAAKSRGEKADEAQRALTEKAQRDLTNVLTQAQQAYTGTPARTIQPDPQEAQQSADYGTPEVGAVNQAAVPGDPSKAASIYMTHPATTGMGTQIMGQQLQQQMLSDALAKSGYGPTAAPQGNPMAAGPTASVMAGGGSTPASGAPAQPRGVPPGVDPLAWSLLVSKGDTAGLAKLVQEAANEQNKPLIDRGYGIKKWNPATGKYELASDLKDITAVEGAKAAGQQPFSMQTTKIPVYLPGGDQITVELNAPQMEQYNRTGKLPPEIASSIPGMQQPPAKAPSPAAFPKETPTERVSAASNQLGILQGELTAEQQKLATATTPEARAEAQSNIANLNKEIATAQKANPGAKAAVIGRTQSQEEGITQTRQTAAGKAVDEAFGKDYVAFKTGGAQDAQKQLAQLGDVKRALEDPKADLTGFFRGKVPDFIQGATNAGQKAIAMRERVEEVVQRSLRVILGAQFTEKEGERLIARAYNPSLGEKENGIRVGRLLTQLEQAYQAKSDAAQYFEKNNTLQGWQGKLPSMADFNPDQGSRSGASGDFGEPSGDQISALLKKYGTNR